MTGWPRTFVAEEGTALIKRAKQQRGGVCERVYILRNRLARRVLLNLIFNTR
jgi:hypothetical protein